MAKTVTIKAAVGAAPAHKHALHSVRFYRGDAAASVPHGLYAEIGVTRSDGGRENVTVPVPDASPVAAAISTFIDDAIKKLGLE